MSSTANIVPPKKEGSGKDGAPAPRPNPVPLEVNVSVTGAKASTQSGPRDLFTEETTTVLVFKDGAVIRLHAAVLAGQLLFLTNKKSNQEVVCQVLHQKSFKPPNSYVELQFTEERADYWGVAFPEGAKSENKFKAPEQKQAEATTEDVAKTPVAPHSAKDVDQLKKEVEALREQLAELERKNAATAAAKAAAESAAREAAAREAASREAAKAALAVLGITPKEKVEIAPVNDPSPERAKVEVEAPLMPEAKDKSESARGVVGMALPIRKEEAPIEKGQDPAEELLPKPALDFSKAAAGGVRGAAPKGRGMAGSFRLIALSALLVLALAGGAWYGKWWEFVPLGNKPDAAATAAAARLNAARAAAARAKAARKAIVGAIDSVVPGGKDDKSSGAANDEDANKKGDAAEENGTAEEKAAAREREANRAAKKKAAGHETPEASAPEMMPVDAPVLPAKLLKAVNPVYPPDAMRSYITGDVKAEVVVEPSGRVGEVKVISGPKALRDAAVEALKQYTYAPATQGGKAVESKTTEVVKFWFNP